MTDHGYADRAELLLETPEHRQSLKLKRALAFLGESWNLHPSRRHTREAHRAHVSSQHGLRKAK